MRSSLEHSIGGSCTTRVLCMSCALQELDEKAGYACMLFDMVPGCILWIDNMPAIGH